MRAAGAGLHAHEGIAAKAPLPLVVRARLLAFLLVVGDDHLDAVVRMMADAALDVIAVAVEDALGDRDVFLEDLAGLELHAQGAVGLLFLGDEDDAAGV